jgi:ATP-dependent helicase HepA
LKDLGIGKVVDLRDKTVIVAYFDVPGEQPTYEASVPRSIVRVFSLPEQTRVFYRDLDSSRWRVGRIIEGEGATCIVAFPNQDVANLPREQLFVRWSKPINNPTEFMIRQVTETPRFAKARAKFVRAVIAQRAACRGIGALLSSSVELADYQFNVVRKVLQDPVQRYLLADEVGLGKTIEVGILIRQYVLDVVAARVLLIVPPSLVTQWRHELIQRFGLLDWIDDHIWVIPSSDIIGVSQHIKTAGMVVVDEVHHLSHISVESANTLYEVLRNQAQLIPRLLLLSGTPVAADTKGFLRILHLLDPVVFPLEDLAGFDRRVSSRQLIAEIAASLVPENFLAMEDDLDRLCDNFGDDQSLMRLVGELRPIVKSLPDENDESFLSVLGALRAYLSETYKLHRRVLRNRRKAVPWATPKRKGLQVLGYANVWQSERQRVIDDLRVYLVNAIEAPGLTRALFSVAVHAGNAESLEEKLLSLGIIDAHARELAQHADELKRRADETGDRESITHRSVRDCLATPGVQVVVFCDEFSTADRLTASLSAALLGEKVEVLRHDCDIENIDYDGTVRHKDWRRFLSEPERCRVLVCDSRAEEGLNLHGGHKVAFHYDLPSQPNRIEQRLGRLDRFGAGSAIRSFAPVCMEDAAEVAWVECLSEGLQVFSVSIASLQYLVEDTLQVAIQDWFNEGVSGLVRWKNQLAGPHGWASRERRRIDQQDSLDAMGAPQSEEFEHLEDVDSQWREWRVAFDDFAFTTLQFHRREESWTGTLTDDECIFRLNYVRDKQRPTLLSLPAFVTRFLGTIDFETRESTAKSPLTYPYAYSRHTVLSKQGISKGLRPLRYGDALVDSLFSFCRSDDRGRIFGMWRYRPDAEPLDSSGCDLWFRFDFLVEANVGESNDDTSRALRRRSEQHFAPQFYTVWFGMIQGATLNPPEILLEEYRVSKDAVGRDFNLNFRRWEMLVEDVTAVNWLLKWRQHCESAAANALEYISGHDLVEQHKVRGLTSLREQYAMRIAQIESRLARLNGPAQHEEQRDMEEERSYFSCLHEAISAPSVRIDAVGAVFVSAKNPFIL